MTRVFVGIVILVCHLSVRAQLTVLGKETNVTPSAIHYVDIQSRLGQAARQGYKRVPTDVNRIDVNQMLSAVQYPITTRLTLSKNASSRSIQPYTGAPLCLIGSDAISEQWLVLNHEELTRLQVSCVLIEAQSEFDLARLRRLSSGVPIFALEMDHALAQTGVNEYPVLIVSGGLGHSTAVSGTKDNQ